MGQCPLEVPARYFNMLLNKLEAGEAYTVWVIWREGRCDCLITFPLEDTRHVDKTMSMAGIDVNPDLVAVTVVLPGGNFKTPRVFPCPGLPYVSHQKQEWIVGNLAQGATSWLSELGVTQVALEELSFAQGHDTNRLFNRLTHNFCKKLLFNRLVVALRKRGLAVFAVSAKFTSLIGYFKYAGTYGLSAHQAAALVIARWALEYA